MIYDEAEPTSPIGQGDIFINIPILDLPTDELAVIGDEDNVHTMTWEEFASLGQPISAVVGIRPTVAIVGTQECDALRAPNITLFEVRSFRDVERLSKDTNRPTKWASIITQHARVNQKWFYLPADETIGFKEKMGVDFLTPIRIPRQALVRLIGFRKARLNEVAKLHFRERVAEFFRRYAYDEWYALTKEELAEYRKTHPDAEPFPWQEIGQQSVIDVEGSNFYVSPQVKKHDLRDTKAEGALADAPYDDSNDKGLLDFLVDGEDAAIDLTDILTILNSETQSIGNKMNLLTEKVNKLASNPSGVKAKDYRKLVLLAASDINTFSKRTEDILPRFERAVELLDRSYSGYVSFADPTNEDQARQVGTLRNSILELLHIIRPSKEGVIGFRDSAVGLKALNISKELNRASERQSEALNGVISNIEHVEGFGLRILFLIDERFGGTASEESNSSP